MGASPDEFKGVLTLDGGKLIFNIHFTGFAQTLIKSRKIVGNPYSGQSKGELLRRADFPMFAS